MMRLHIPPEIDSPPFPDSSTMSPPCIHPPGTTLCMGDSIGQSHSCSLWYSLPSILYTMPWSLHKSLHKYLCITKYEYCIALIVRVIQYIYYPFFIYCPFDVAGDIGVAFYLTAAKQISLHHRMAWTCGTLLGYWFYWVINNTGTTICTHNRWCIHNLYQHFYDFSLVVKLITLVMY